MPLQLSPDEENTAEALYRRIFAMPTLELWPGLYTAEPEHIGYCVFCGHDTRPVYKGACQECC